MNRWLTTAGVICLGGLLLTLALAAEPGSKDDPLATVTYVREHAQFVRVDIAAGRSLRLGDIAEVRRERWAGEYLSFLVDKPSK